MDTSCGAPARLQKQLRLWGIVTIPLTIISFGIAVGLDTFIQNPALGGWYIAIITFCTAMFALVPRSRGIVIVTLVGSVIACILGFAISVVDGGSANLISTIKACANPSSTLPDESPVFTYTGNSLYFPMAANCSIEHLDFDCSCVSSMTDGNCYLFDGQTNCELVTTKFVDMLRAATAFNVLSLLAVFAISVSTCCSLCCPGSGCVHDPEEEHAIQQYAPNPAYVETRPAVVYVGTVQTQEMAPNSTVYASASPSSTPYGQHPQIQALNQYNSPNGGRVAEAVPVVYGKA